MNFISNVNIKYETPSLLYFLPVITTITSSLMQGIQNLGRLYKNPANQPQPGWEGYQTEWTKLYNLGMRWILLCP